jgi:integrase/recombinase XerD
MWLDCNVPEQDLAWLGNTVLKFRVQVSPEDESLRSLLEAEGLRWNAQEGCFDLEAGAQGTDLALAAIDEIASRLGQLVHCSAEQPAAGAAIDATAMPLAVMDIKMAKLNDAQARVLRRFEECIAQHQYSPKTLRNYKNAFRSFLIAIAPKLPVEMTKEDVMAWIAARMQERQGSTSLHNTLINAIKFYYVSVERRPSGGYVFERPKNRVAAPLTLTKPEMQSMMAHTVNLKHRCLLLLSYSTGLRLKEVLGLRRGDVEFDRRTIAIYDDRPVHASAIRKIERTVPLSPKLIDALKGYFEEFNPLFWLFEGERPGLPYSERSAQMVVKQAARRAGLKQQVSMHMLRNSYATHQLEAGIAVAAVQDLMGHGSIRTTGRYAHVARRKMTASPVDDMEL